MTFVKGHKLATGRPKGSKNTSTLFKEERRAIFDAEVSKKWLDIIERLPDIYVSDQFIGKAPQAIDITSGGEKISGVVIMPPLKNDK